MRRIFISLILNISLSAQKFSCGRKWISLWLEHLARKLNQESISLKPHEGYWFRHHENLVFPIGKNLPIKIHQIRSWSTLSNHHFFDERKRWWFSHYTPQNGDIIIDVGAGMGEDAYLFSKTVGLSGAVIAIEAHPQTAHILNQFVSLNQLTNVQTLNVAASDKKDRVWISDLTDEDWQCNSIITHQNAAHGAEIETMKIDDIPIVNQHPSIAFLKMNIEGAEILALNGARQTLAKTHRVCICCHDFLGPQTETKQQVCALLKDAGFTLSFTDPSSPPYERDFVYGSRLS